MRWRAARQAGFTIVELLIVIIVIAILATIATVAYSGIRERAVVSQVQTALSQAHKAVLAYAAEHSDQYPAALADAGINDTDAVSYQYTSDNVGSPRKYAITASDGPGGATSFYVSSTQGSLRSGIAPGHNLLAWNEPNTTRTPFAPIAGATVDTTQARTGSASIKIAPGNPRVNVRTGAVAGDIGQVLTLRLWLKTDASWDGTNGNSKVRFGKTTGGGLVSACGYAGVKVNWTQVICNHTFSSADPSVEVAVGNDGTTGNIWIDDVYMSVQ